MTSEEALEGSCGPHLAPSLAVQQHGPLLCAQAAAHGTEVQRSGEDGDLGAPGGWPFPLDLLPTKGGSTGMGVLDRLWPTILPVTGGLPECLSWPWYGRNSPFSGLAHLPGPSWPPVAGCMGTGGC